MMGIEFLRENGFIGYENGRFRMAEEETREKARAKGANELMEIAMEKAKEEKQSYRGR